MEENADLLLNEEAVLFEQDQISKEIESAFSNFSNERPFDLEQCTDIVLSALPDTVLLKIFSNLTHPELCHIALVCKHWLWVVYDSELWKFVDFSRCNKVDEKTIIQLIQSRLSPLLKTLDLSNCSFSPNIVQELTDSCQQLDTLVLQNCDLTSTLENKLNCLSVPGNLTRLDIRNFKAGFQFMHVILEAQDMSHLECFGFGNNHFCPAFTNFQTMFSKMHALKILECVDCEFISDSEVIIFAKTLKNLESLVLKNCKNLNGSSLGHLINGAKELKSLNLSGTGVNDLALSNFPWESSIIEEFDLSFCDEITSAGLIVSIPKMDLLESLLLSNTGRGKAVTGEVLEAAYSIGNWKHLNVLSLHFANRLFNQAFSFLQNCSNLQWLSLRTCYRIDFECIAANLKYFPRLLGLECGSLFATGNSTNQWVQLLQSISINCKNMRHLILLKCVGLPLSRVTEYKNLLLGCLETMKKLETISVLYSEEAIYNLIESCINLSSSRASVKMSSPVPIIPPFRHSLDSEINKSKFRKYFGY